MHFPFFFASKQRKSSEVEVLAGGIGLCLLFTKPKASEYLPKSINLTDA